MRNRVPIIYRGFGGRESTCHIRGVFHPGQYGAARIFLLQFYYAALFESAADCRRDGNVHVAGGAYFARAFERT